MHTGTARKKDGSSRPNGKRASMPTPKPIPRKRQSCSAACAAICPAIFPSAPKPLFKPPTRRRKPSPPRSEEHTSELQSLMRISYAVFCLKKKTKYTTNTLDTTYNNTHTTHKRKQYISV